MKSSRLIVLFVGFCLVSIPNVGAAEPSCDEIWRYWQNFNKVKIAWNKTARSQFRCEESYTGMEPGIRDFQVARAFYYMEKIQLAPYRTSSGALLEPPRFQDWFWRVKSLSAPGRERFPQLIHAAAATETPANFIYLLDLFFINRTHRTDYRPTHVADQVAMLVHEGFHIENPSEDHVICGELSERHQGTVNCERSLTLPTEDGGGGYSQSVRYLWWVVNAGYSDELSEIDLEDYKAEARRLMKNYLKNNFNYSSRSEMDSAFRLILQD